MRASQRFDNRPEAIDFGRDFEYLMAAHHALRFVLVDSVLDYKMSTNNKTLGDFDDLVLEVEFDDKSHHVYAIQLKHKANKDNKLTLNALGGDTGKFSVLKYQEDFKVIRESYRRAVREIESTSANFEDFRFILYTNASLPAFWGYSNKGEREEVDMLPLPRTQIKIVRHDECTGRGLIDVSNDTNNNKESHYIFKFVTTDQDQDGGDMDPSFFDQFFLYTKQKNAKEVEWAISKMIFANFPHCDPSILPKFLSYIKHWYRGDFGFFKLTKWDMKVKLAELLLTPYVPELVVADNWTGNNHVAKWDLLNQIMTRFDLTWCQNFAGPLSQIWAVILGEFRGLFSSKAGCWSIPIPELTASSLLQARQIPLSAQVESLRELSLRNLYVIMWHSDIFPLLIVVEETAAYELVKAVCELFRKETRKKKLVVVANNDSFSPPLTGHNNCFRNLKDLEPSDDLYRRIMFEFSISLQGGRPIIFDEFLGNSLMDHITASLLIKLASEEVVIGENAALKLPNPYIVRRVPKIALSFNIFDEIRDELFIVECWECDQFSAQLTLGCVRIDHYLTLSRCPDTKDYVPKQFPFSQWKQKSKISDDKFAIVAQSITQSEFDEICSLNPDKPCHLLKALSENQLEWRTSRGSVNKLRQYKIESEDFVTDNSVISHFCGKLHVLCADPGMGKSVTLDYLKLLWSDSCWVVKIDLNMYVKLFRKPYDDGLTKRLLYQKKRLKDQLEQATITSYLKRRKVLILWDGFDELPSACTSTVIQVIQEFKSQGYVQWVTSRNWSKEVLESTFDTFSLTLAQFSKEDQQEYLEIRCQSKCQQYGYSIADVQRMVNDMYQKMTVLFDCGYSDYSGVPLQIYMVTEIFQHDPQKYMEPPSNDELITVVDIYREFIEGKFNCLFGKANAISQNYQMERIQDKFKKMLLGEYEVAALKATFVEAQLNIDCLELLQDIEDSGDFLGIIVYVNNEDKTATFAHKTYQEFLAASWLHKNYSEYPELVKALYNVDFSNVRLMFDILVVEKSPAHLAALFKDQRKFLSDRQHLGARDQMGRTPLHLVCSWGRRHQKLQQSADGHGKVRGLKDVGDAAEEDPTYLRILHVLLRSGSDPLDCDRFFGWNAYQFADRVSALATLNMLLKFKQFPINQLESYDEPTILHYSVLFNYRRLFAEIKSIPYVEYEELKDTTLLQFAVEMKRTMMVRRMLKFDWYRNVINKTNFDHNTPLGSAVCVQMDVRMVELLIQNGARVNGCDAPPLLFAIGAGRLDMVQKLIKDHSADVNEIGHNGFSALGTAAALNNTDMIACLVENGADVNRSDNDVAPLDYVLHYENLDALEILIDKRVDLNKKCQGLGYTSLHRMAEKNNTEILRLLLSSGADSKIKCNRKNTPLHVAVLNSRSESALLLLDADQSVMNEVNVDGCTPLLYAARHGLKLVLERLLELGVDPNGALLLPSPLHNAIYHDHPECAQLLIAKGASVNKIDCGAGPPLFYAVKARKLNMIQLLLDSGAQVDMRGNNNLSSLHLAACDGYIEEAHELLNRGANINAVDQNGDTPLETAAQTEQIEMVELLLKRGAEIPNQGDLLYTAANKKDPSLLEVLLCNGLDVNSKAKDGDTALFVAVTSKESCVDVLIKWKADINVLHEKYLRTPLYYAVLYGNSSITKKLLEAGAKTTVNGSLEDPIHIAAAMGNLVCLVLLLEAGADVEASCPKDGMRPLHYTALINTDQSVSYLNFMLDIEIPNHWRISYNNLECLKILLDRGADVNAKCNNGVTPLHFACTKKQSEIVKCLIDNKADVQACTETKVTPLHVACCIGSIENCRMLIQQGAMLDALDSFGRTPLSYAAEMGNGDIVDFLVERKAELNHIEGAELDCTPLLMAVAKGNIWIVEKLIEAGADINLAGFVDKSMLMLGSSTLDDFMKDPNSSRLEKKSNIQKIIHATSTMILEDFRKPGEKSKVTPVMLALQSGDIDLLKGLIARAKSSASHLPNNVRLLIDGIKENLTASLPNRISSSNADSLLRHAIASKDLEVVQLFPSYGVTIEDAHILEAIKIDSLEIVQFLYEHLGHFNIDFLYESISVGNVRILDYFYTNGWQHIDKDCVSPSLLSKACSCGQIECTKYLLEKGENLNKIDSDGLSPLIYSIIGKNFDMVRLLVDQGATLYLEDSKGFSPLHYAVHNSEILQFLIDKGACLDYSNIDGLTPLHVAAHLICLDSAFHLIAAGSQVNAVDTFGCTPLYWACHVNPESATNHTEEDCLQMVKLLIDSGADVSIRNKNGNTALSSAVSAGLLSVMEYLHNVGASVHVVDEQGDTPLHDASVEGNLGKVKFLVEKGADPKWKNHDGKMPSDLAGNEEVKRYLSEIELDLD